MPRDPLPTAEQPKRKRLERLADDVRWGFVKSEYARGFNDGIDAFIARLMEEETDG